MKIALVALFVASITFPAASQGPPAPDRYDVVVTHAFSAPLPCAFACPYYLETDDDTCRPEPNASPLSYEDWDFRATVPPDASDLSFLVFALEVGVDLDSWICFQESHPSAPDRWFVEVPHPQLCRTLVGCSELGELVVCRDVHWNSVPEGFGWQCIPNGAPLTFRVYNWLEPDGEGMGALCWSRRGVGPNPKDCLEALPGA